MTHNERLLVLGEDVTYWGAVFGFTMGLFPKYGRERVVDMPITEQTFMGMAVGAASVGLHPVVSLVFVDFCRAGFDQMLNHLAKNHYMAGGQLPMPVTVIIAIRGGYGDAAQHSQVGLQTLRSRHKTGRVLIVDEDYELWSNGRSGLSHPGQCLQLAESADPATGCTRCTNPPFSEPLESAVIPSGQRIYEAARSLVDAKAMA